MNAISKLYDGGIYDTKKYRGELIKSDDDDMFAFLDTKYVSKIKQIGRAHV